MSSRRYTNGLGFRVIFAMPGRDGSSQLIHLRCSRYQDLLLVRAWRLRETGIPAGVGVALYFQFEDDWDVLASLAEQARQTEGSVVEGPIDTPWNTREVNMSVEIYYTTSIFPSVIVASSAIEKALAYGSSG
ncbi:MAG: VOC family protein [Ktedonobacteraceae bacterium]